MEELMWEALMKFMRGWTLIIIALIGVIILAFKVGYDLGRAHGKEEAIRKIEEGLTYEEEETE
ncbi:MAG: hypothetical protein RMK89_13980 [Armatimonadota bacterium]|nr:hypothetical protein [Armatimonadota bacterium]MDW8144554.1 hypothetical protein [Armatimonadota bacterium]